MGEKIFASCLLITAVLIWFNVVKLLKDEEVRGVHWAPLLFSSLFATYATGFFAYTGLYWNAATNALLAVAYYTWTGLVFYYWRK